MYISYECTQWYTNKEQELFQYDRPPKKIPTVLPKPEFMPTRLLRISDLKLVEGSQVHEGYCALSYSRDQSGDRLLDEVTGKPKRRIDEGKHRIIRKRRRVKEFYGTNDDDELDNEKDLEIKHVKFEGLIQQICLQFNIKYVWYDQMCINQATLTAPSRLSLNSVFEKR
ncbi:hypothetical protein BDA99DRAFT_543223 [Phascolomyces articulosus]|uniref:Heterokaryon incompatibility domain-containing protein n=1 Tax=Phascolomyces articulosus TaxID=60185 RepID=A0AAD5JZE9_9FUNG|nr:hypothetical protein BDA99DRAFT_543223 [Phascolomyces articulosus]